MAKHRILTLAITVAAATSVAAQQHEMTTPTSQRYHEPIKLYTVGLGPFVRPISSTNAEAQKYFNQGFQMMYAFAKPRPCGRSARRGSAIPDCAICYWGEAWAMGSYLNGAMTAPESPLAYEAMQKALRLKSKGSEKERDFIDALVGALRGKVRRVEAHPARPRIRRGRCEAQ
jgi:hypothetical protein